MVEEKSDAQIKNEEEVQRILRERGYSSKSSKKQVAKTFGKSFSLKPLIILVLIVAVAVGGWFFLKDSDLFKNQGSNPTDNKILSQEINQDYIDFQSCIDSIDKSEIPLDDADFWNKHITRYENTISCYEKYPSVANISEKNDIQSKLDNCIERSKQADANNEEYRRTEVENEKKYQEALARNQSEYERKTAELDAETEKKLEEYDRQRDERNAQYAKEKAEREAKQARCDSFKAQYPNVETYKAKNGNLDELWNAYQNAKSEYSSALNAYGHSNPNHSDEWREAVWNGVKEKEATMNAAYNAWSSSNTSLSSGYNNGFREACL